MGPPVITSQGPPPERHAARVVGEMCRWLAAELPSLKARHMELLKGSFRKLGNPKAQARFMARLSRDRELGHRFLATSLIPGKRGKCALQAMTWELVTPDGERIADGDPIPAAPWLRCLLEVIYIRDREASFIMPVVTVTHHAMQRLAERCDARTTDDLLMALRDISLWMLERPEMTLEDKAIHVPVAGGVAIVEDVPKHGWLVKTVLDAAWVDTPR